MTRNAPLRLISSVRSHPFLCHLVERLDLDDTGAHHEGVEPTHALDGGRHRVPDGRRVADIADVTRCGVAQLGDRSFESGLRNVHEGHSGTVEDQLTSDGEPNPDAPPVMRAPRPRATAVIPGAS